MTSPRKQGSTKLLFPHPGEMLKFEFLEEMDVSQYRLAKETGIPHSRVSAIVNGRHGITAAAALKFGRYFGNTADYWMNLQKEYDLRKARDELKEALARIRPHQPPA